MVYRVCFTGDWMRHTNTYNFIFKKLINVKRPFCIWNRSCFNIHLNAMLTRSNVLWTIFWFEHLNSGMICNWNHCSKCYYDKGNLFLLKDKIRTTQQSLLLPKCPPQAFYMQCKHKKEHFCINNSKIDNHETIFQEKNGQQKMTYGFIVNIVQNTITF